MGTEDRMTTMNGLAFRRWRKRHKLSQKDAAKALGLKPRIIQYYEKGERDGKAVEIPLSVRLACYALDAGVTDYDGQDAHFVQSAQKKAKA